MNRSFVPPILLLLTLSIPAFQGCSRYSKPASPARPAKPPAAAPAVKPPGARPVPEKPQVTKPAPEKLPSVKPTPAKPPAVALSDKLFAEGMAALQDGGHEKALELFAASWKEKPDHEGVAREFPGVLIALKKNGDSAYAQGKWEDAGKRWMGTLRYVSHPAAKGKAVPFTRADVQAQVDKLTAALMEKGLLEYRKENIEPAIAYWKTILAYDPANAEAAKSIRTATTQLQKLKKLPPAPHPAPPAK